MQLSSPWLLNVTTKSWYNGVNWLHDKFVMFFHLPLLAVFQNPHSVLVTSFSVPIATGKPLTTLPLVSQHQQQIPRLSRNSATYCSRRLRAIRNRPTSSPVMLFCKHWCSSIAVEEKQYPLTLRELLRWPACPVPCPSESLLSTS